MQDFRMESLIQNIKQTGKDVRTSFHSVFFFSKGCFFELGNVLKNSKYLFLFFFHLLMLIFSCLGFYGNLYVQGWACSMQMQDDISDNGYLCAGLQTPDFLGSDKTIYSSLSDLGSSINSSFLGRTFSFIVPISNDVPAKFEGQIGDISFSSSIADFFSYYDESVGETRFSGAALAPFDSSRTGVSFSSYPFAGKDGSSFISQRLADKIIAGDTSGEFRGYSDFLGKSYSLVFGGRIYHLSINNIYLKDTLLENEISGMLLDPIITNVSGLFSSRCSLVSGVGSDAITFRQLLRKFYLFGRSEFYPSFFFLSSDGVRISCSYENTIKIFMENWSYSYLKNIESWRAIIAVIFLVLLPIEFWVQVIFAKKGWLVCNKTFFSFSAFNFFCFLAISILLSILFHQTILRFLFLNAFFGFEGSLFVLLSLWLVLPKISHHLVEEAKIKI